MLAPVLLFWTLVAGEKTITEHAWGNSCPMACTCHLGHFADLPINQWLQKEKATIFPAPSSTTNEAFYEEDATEKESSLYFERGELLKIAICIFQSGSDPQKLLSKLPKDTQALTLLQSRGSEEITLEIEYMTHFQQLVFLDIQGYCPEVWKEESYEHKTQHKFMLHNDVLKPLASLQFLSLQHVQLLGSSMKSNKIDHEGYSPPQLDPHQNEIVINQFHDARDKIRRNLKTYTPNLVFLKPSMEEQELLSYRVYKEQQERARLSIFARLSNLILLRAIDCGLHEVYWEMFEGLPKLEHLTLEKNQLLFLPEFAFYGAPNLKSLSLAHNKLLNIHSTGLAGLLELQKLDLSYNNFSHLSEFSLPPFPKLKEAYFWHNPIEAVFASTFEIMNATSVLYLGGNNSSLVLHPKSFQGLILLKKLVLHNVGIEVLERELLSGMPELRYLKISGTISSISFDAFIDSPMLETLDLQYCKIKSVSMDTFYGLLHMEVLDLSNNLLESLPPGVFDQQISLKELYLQNNSLTELPDGFFTNLSSKIVRLEGNLWHCSCNMKTWLPSVTNRIKELKTVKSVCENDKGIGCPPSLPAISYVYEKKVAPRCNTPAEFKGWSVYYVLRKEMRCSKQVYKKIIRREYIKRKYKDYQRSNVTEVKKNPPYISYQNKMKNTFIESMNNQSYSNTAENIALLKKSAISDKMQINSTSHALVTQLSSMTSGEFATTGNPKEPNNDEENSLTKLTEQQTGDNTVPLIPSANKTFLHNRIHMQHKPDKIISNILPDSLVVSDNKKEIEKGSLGMVMGIKLSALENPQNVKFLKKLWKTEQHRKHQEKMKLHKLL